MELTKEQQAILDGAKGETKKQMEQVLGGTFLQHIGKLEQQRRESEFLENGTKLADGEDYGKSIYTPRRR